MPNPRKEEVETAGGEKRGAWLKDGSTGKRERELEKGSKSNGCSELISSPEGDKRGKEEKSCFGPETREML